MDEVTGPDKKLLSSLSARLARGEALAVAEEMLVSPKISKAVIWLSNNAQDPTICWVASWSVRIARLDTRYHPPKMRIPKTGKGAEHQDIPEDTISSLIEIYDSHMDMDVRKNARIAITKFAAKQANISGAIPNLINVLSGGYGKDMSFRKADLAIDPAIAIKVLRQYVSKARQCVPADRIRIHEQIAVDEYRVISEVAKSSKSKIGSDGELLSGERPKPPKGMDQGGMFRSASNAQAITPIKRAERIA